ncbi:cell surface antigen-like protein Sca13, partial [Rickettsia felis]
SGGNSGSGISRSNANDGFNAAHDNTSTGTQEVGKRLKTLKDEVE